MRARRASSPRERRRRTATAAVTPRVARNKTGTLTVGREKLAGVGREISGRDVDFANE